MRSPLIAGIIAGLVLSYTPWASAAYRGTTLAGMDNASIQTAAGIKTFADALTCSGGFTFGVAGTRLLQMQIYLPNLTPTILSSRSVSPQSFSMPGVLAGDKAVMMNIPSSVAGVGFLSADAPSNDTIRLYIQNLSTGTPTPPAGVYRFVMGR